MTPMTPVPLTLSSAEFSVLASLSEGVQLLEDWILPLQPTTTQVVFEGLLSRELLRQVAGERFVAPVEVAPLLGPLLTAVCAIDALVLTARDEHSDEPPGPAVAVHALVGADGTVIEHAPRPGGLHALWLSSPGQVAARAVAALGLSAGERAASTVRGEPLTLTAEQLGRVSRSLLASAPPSSPEEALPEAPQFAEAMLNADGARSFSVAYATDDGDLAAAEVRWIDGADAGCWTVAANAEQTLVRRVARTELAAQITGLVADA